MNLNNLRMIFPYLNEHRPLPRLQTAPSPRCWSSLEVRLWSKRGKPQNERSSLWGEDVNAREKRQKRNMWQIACYVGTE